jgi:hypothetical protein
VQKDAFGAMGELCALWGMISGIATMSVSCWVLSDV